MIINNMINRRIICVSKFFYVRMHALHIYNSEFDYMNMYAKDQRMYKLLYKQLELLTCEDAEKKWQEVCTYSIYTMHMMVHLRVIQFFWDSYEVLGSYAFTFNFVTRRILIPDYFIEVLTPLSPASRIDPYFLQPSRFLRHPSPNQQYVCMSVIAITCEIQLPIAIPIQKKKFIIASCSRALRVLGPLHFLRINRVNSRR